ncbi:MAG: acetolactate synthase large subunit [Maricaulaceae bacterium]|jgi:acetolactate synthase-1/2/3 large subunit
MNGAESLLATLVSSGVEACFSNPGTSEMHFVAAVDRTEGMRPVLCLFEGVATGAADGYGRMAGKPAATLLHLGPGLANGLANLHNAKRAATPIVNIVGDHATYHAQYDAPLTSDIAGVAKPFSKWIHSSPDAKQVAADAARAVAEARRPPGQIATLILPADTAWNEADGAADPIAPEQPGAPDPKNVSAVAAALKSGKRAVILLRGDVLFERPLAQVGRIAKATGARIMCDTFTARLERGAGRFAPERLPYFAERAAEALEGVETLILVGTKPPVSFFAYPDKPSWLTPDGCEIITLSEPSQSGADALDLLAEAVGAQGETPDLAPASRPDLPQAGPIDSVAATQIVGHFLPEGAIISDEAATSGRGLVEHTAGAPPHDILSLTGGSIGQGVPLATGAAVACPDRKVVCLQGDGGAMYTLQALWTQAREKLDVTTVIFANRSYAILNIEMKRVGAEGGAKALSMLDLHNPELDWVKLAEGMGVHAMRAETTEAFADQFARCMRERGPHLIEVVHTR